MPLTEPITPAGALHRSESTARVATRRRLLMCRPRHYDVTYSINPWMNPQHSTDNALAVRQWEGLRDLYLELGHVVEEIDPLEGLPDMVFAANGATVVDGKVYGARFRHAERTAEGPAYLRWLEGRGYTDTLWPEFVNEGEGDILTVGRRLLAGTGFRTDPRSHAEAQEFFGLPVTSLTLVNPDYYHLDTALAVLSDDEVMYYRRPSPRAARPCCGPSSPTRSWPVRRTRPSSGSTPSPTAATCSCPPRPPACTRSCGRAGSSRSASSCPSC